MAWGRFIMRVYLPYDKSKAVSKLEWKTAGRYEVTIIPLHGTGGDIFPIKLIILVQFVPDISWSHFTT